MTAYGDWGFAPRLFDRLDNYVCEPDALSATWVENLDGEDTVTMETTQAVAKYDRLVWRDWTGRWHEHVADEPQVARTGSGVPVYTVAFRTALYDLDAYHVASLYRPQGKSAQEALGHLLAGTRWAVGDCSGLGTTSASFYHVSALEAVRSLAQAWGGDLYSEVSVDTRGVTSRRVCLKPRGSDNGRRFDYGRDLVGVTRSVAAGGVYTALYGYGKGEEVGNGYGRRLTFEGVEAADSPKGQAWVGDDAAREAWGIPDGSGGVAHRFGCATFEDCEDASELLRLTRARLQEVKAPQVTYDLDVLAISDAGLDTDDVGVGDTVEFVDEAFEPTLRGTARVTERTVDLLSRASVALRIGDGVEGASDRMKSYESRLDAMRTQAATWQAASSAAPDYLRQLLSGISELSNLGLSYKVESPELGVMVANVPLDPETGAPTASAPSAGYSCLRLRAGYIQTSSRYESGAWVWETAVQGGGIVANAITSGVIAGADYWAGKGGAHWDLGAGGALTIEGYATDADLEGVKGDAAQAKGDAAQAKADAAAASTAAGSAGESAANALAMANGAVRSYDVLYYITSSFVPSPPTSEVTSEENKAGVWTKRMVWTSGTASTYVCYQYHYRDGSVGWSKVFNDYQVYNAMRNATSFLQLSDGSVTCGNRSGGSFVGTRTVMDASAFHIQGESGNDLAVYGKGGETFYDDEGGVVGYASYQAATYVDDGQSKTTNMQVLGGADMAKLWGALAAMLEMTNGKTGADYKTAHVSCAYPTGTVGEDPSVDLYAYSSNGMSQLIVKPKGVQCSAQALNVRTWQNTSAVQGRRHMGVCTLVFNGLKPGSTISAGSYVMAPFTLPQGFRPKSGADTVSTLVNDDGVSAIVTVGGDGTAYIHARGQDLRSGVALWGQIAYFAEA